MNNIKKNWCDFVLNEGIMPANFVRKLKNEQKSENELCILIADILSNKSFLYQLPEKTMISAAFNTDPELVKWLDSTQELLNVIKTFADKDSHFTNIVNEACLSFIKICPLVSETRKQFYLEAPSTPNLTPISSSDPKQAFRDYLTKCGYSFNTINSYISSINTVSNLTNIQRDLWNINNANEMQRFYNNLEANTEHLYDEYKQKDIYSRKTLSNALKRYIEFLKGIDTSAIYQAKNFSKERIGSLVQGVFRNLLQSGKISKYEIRQLMDMDYCKQIFKTRGNQFPILATEERDEIRYYKYPIKIDNEIYYISSQWYDEQLPYLKEWLRKHGEIV